MRHDALALVGRRIIAVIAQKELDAPRDRIELFRQRRPYDLASRLTHGDAHPEPLLIRARQKSLAVLASHLRGRVLHDSHALASRHRQPRALFFHPRLHLLPGRPEPLWAGLGQDFLDEVGSGHRLPQQALLREVDHPLLLPRRDRSDQVLLVCADERGGRLHPDSLVSRFWRTCLINTTSYFNQNDFRSKPSFIFIFLINLFLYLWRRKNLGLFTGSLLPPKFISSSILK